MGPEDAFRHRLIAEADARMRKLVHSRDLQKEWVERHPTHPHIQLARQLLAQMDRAVMECEQNRDALYRLWLTSPRRP